MSDTKSELKAWISEINGATNSLQIFQMMEDFRVGNWSDEERAQIAKIYIAALGRMDVIEFPGDAKADGRTKADNVTEPEGGGDKGGKVAVVEKGADEPGKEVGKIDEEVIEEEVWYEKM